MESSNVSGNGRAEGSGSWESFLAHRTVKIFGRDKAAQLLTPRSRRRRTVENLIDRIFKNAETSRRIVRN